MEPEEGEKDKGAANRTDTARDGRRAIQTEDKSQFNQAARKS